MQNNNQKFFFSPLFSLILLLFGTNLIISSVINIFSLEYYFSNQKVVQLPLKLNTPKDNFLLEGKINNKKNNKLIPRFVVREDLSIQGLSINFASLEDNKRNNLPTNQPIILSNLDYGTKTLNQEIPDSNLQKELSDAYTNLIGLKKNLQKTLSDPPKNLFDIKTKKEKFINLILPVVVKQNEEIRNNRKKLQEIKNYLIINRTLNKNDQHFLNSMASKYKINTVNKHKIDTIEILLELVDEIPNSIVLAQAANESGWGTSRFAKEFNALFGEYTFDINIGVAPISRNDGEKHLIKFFSNIDDSIKSYFNNLNTHPAYKRFRVSRKELRAIDLELDPMILVKYLKPYAQDKNYVKNIKSIIKTNKLTQFDSLIIITTKL